MEDIFSHLIIFFHQCVQTDRQHGHERGKGGYALVGIKYTRTCISIKILLQVGQQTQMFSVQYTTQRVCIRSDL